MERDRLKSLGKLAGLAGAGILMASGIISSSVAATAMPMVTTVLPNVPGNFVVIDAFPSVHVAA